MGIKSPQSTETRQEPHTPLGTNTVENKQRLFLVQQVLNFHLSYTIIFLSPESRWLHHLPSEMVQILANMLCQGSTLHGTSFKPFSMGLAIKCHQFVWILSLPPTLSQEPWDSRCVLPCLA